MKNVALVRRLVLPAIICACALGAATAQYSSDGFKSIFNGKDLTGWVDVNTSPDTWSVKDGC